MVDKNPLPQTIESEAELEDVLSEPYPEDVEFVDTLDGDILVLGAGGKMGPSLVRRIHRASDAAGTDTTVYAVSRYSDPDVRSKIESWGVETIQADLLADGALSTLPDCENVIYMVGMKFGMSGREPKTWALNAYLPGRIARHCSDSRIVAFSTGNVYPLVSAESDGPTEDDPVGPVGEYAQSCLGRERVFQHFSTANDTPVCLIRLNYAVELRYGVLYDIARWVYEGEPVPLDMGYVNVIWQGDANSVCLRALDEAATPASVLNVTGPEVLSVRELAEQFADRFGTGVEFEGEEQPTALLNDASRCHETYGEPTVSTDEVVDHVASWIERGKPTMDKPTKFQVRSGDF